MIIVITFLPPVCLKGGLLDPQNLFQDESFCPVKLSHFINLLNDLLKHDRIRYLKVFKQVFHFSVLAECNALSTKRRINVIGKLGFLNAA